jgi:hypothetical protein
MRFRKNVLKKENITDFYDNVIQFAKTPTHNRGSASGSKHKNINEVFNDNKHQHKNVN